MIDAPHRKLPSPSRDRRGYDEIGEDAPETRSVRELPIPLAINSLEIRCDDLLKMISVLQDRLGRAMRADRPGPECVDKDEKRAELSEMCERIEGIRGTVGEAMHKIENIIERLEI